MIMQIGVCRHALPQTLVSLALEHARRVSACLAYNIIDIIPLPSLLSNIISSSESYGSSCGGGGGAHGMLLLLLLLLGY